MSEDPMYGTFKQVLGFVVSPCEFCQKPIPPGEIGCFVGMLGTEPTKVVAAHASCAEEALKAGKCKLMRWGDRCWCDRGLYDNGDPCRNCDGLGSHDAMPYNGEKAYQLGETRPPVLFAIVNSEGKMLTLVDGDDWTHLDIFLTKKDADETLEKMLKDPISDDGEDARKYRVVRYVPEVSREEARPVPQAGGSDPQKARL